MKNILILFSSIHMLFFLNADAFGLDETLCDSDEIMVASCVLNEKKRRVLSFCSSADKKTIVYRFGVEQKIDLINDFSVRSPVSRWIDKWTYTTYLGFRVNEYSYVLGVPQEKYGARAFLEVAKNDVALMDRSCLENSFGEKDLDSEAIMDVEDRIVRDNKFLFPPIEGMNDKSPKP